MEEMFKKLIVEAIQEVIAANTQTVPVKEIMTRDQLAEYLQVSVAWIDKNIRDIPHLKGVGGTRFRKVDIDSWLDRKLESAVVRTVNVTSTSKKSTYKVI